MVQGNSRNQEYNHALMEQGEQAALMDTLIRPIVDRMIRDKVIHLTNVYRAGDADFNTLLGKVAEISALDMLLRDLEAEQRQGIIAREKELGNATQEADSSFDDS